MNISHALANSTGASLEIIDVLVGLLIFLILARGSWWFLKSDPDSISRICCRQNMRAAAGGAG